MGFGKWLGALGGIAAAPFTGGSSLLPLLITSGVGVGSALANRKSARTQTYQDPPEYTGLRDMLINRVTQRLRQPALPQGYEEGGIRDINNVYDLVKQSKMNDLTGRGLGDSPVAGNVLGAGEDARAGQIARFESGLPMAARQFESQNLNEALGVFGQRNPSVTAPGSAVGSSLTDMGSILAFLYGSGMLGAAKGKATT